MEINNTHTYLIPPDGVIFEDAFAIGKINYVDKGIQKLHRFPKNHKRLPRKLKKVIKNTYYFPMLKVSGEPRFGTVIVRNEKPLMKWLEEKLNHAANR